MGGWIAALGQQVAGTAAQGAMGILAQRIGKNYDRKQWIKDFEVQAPRQMALEKQLMDYQQQKQMEMWEKTNYDAQVSQLEKAGLNPALLYGQGGGGGTTVGGGMPSAPQQHSTSTGTGSGVVQGMNILTSAQVKLMEAQARKLNVDADKTAGVDTENTKADTAVKNQTIQNLIASAATEKAKKALTEIQTKLQTFEANFKEQTFDDMTKTVHSNMNMAMEMAKKAEAEATISYGTMKEVMEGIKQDAINKIIYGALMNAQKKNVDADTKNKPKQGTLLESLSLESVGRRLQGWKGLSQDAWRMEIDKTLREAGLDQNERQQALESVKMIMGGAMRGIKDEPDDYEERYEDWYDAEENRRGGYRRRRY